MSFDSNLMNTYNNNDHDDEECVTGEKERQTLFAQRNT